MQPAIPNVRDVLPLPKLQLLRDRYRREEAIAAVSSILPFVYDKSRDYNAAVTHAFYGDLPSDTRSTREALSVQDRERCLIALLCSRGVPETLAVHIYLGLMEGISVEEVANILMLTGMYTGIDRFVTGLATELTALKALGELVDENGRLDAAFVLNRLKDRFDPTARPSGR